MVNIVICGTPGTGKSTIMNMVREKLKDANLDINFINISEYAKENDCIEEYDAELDTHVIDDDKLEEKLKSLTDEPNRNNFFESIHADIVPEQSIDHVFVVIMDNHTHLYDRLVARNYNSTKLTNNIECEIFQEIKNDTIEVFGDDKVTLLYNDTIGFLEPNVQSVCNKFLQLVGRH